MKWYFFGRSRPSKKNPVFTTGDMTPFFSVNRIPLKTNISHIRSYAYWILTVNSYTVFFYLVTFESICVTWLYVVKKKTFSSRRRERKKNTNQCGVWFSYPIASDERVRKNYFAYASGVYGHWKFRIWTRRKDHYDA